MAGTGPTHSPGVASPYPGNDMSRENSHDASAPRLDHFANPVSCFASHNTDETQLTA